MFAAMHDFAHMVMMVPVAAAVLTAMGIPYAFTAFLGEIKNFKMQFVLFGINTRNL
jgi:hypothetical protein